MQHLIIGAIWIISSCFQRYTSVYHNPLPCPLQQNVLLLYTTVLPPSESCYYISLLPMTYEEAVNFCEVTLNMHMVFIEGHTEDHVIQPIIRLSRRSNPLPSHFWLGSYTTGTSSYWTYWKAMLASKMTYEIWGNFGEYELVAGMVDVDRGWFREAPTKLHHAMCEIELDMTSALADFRPIKAFPDWSNYITTEGVPTSTPRSEGTSLTYPQSTHKASTELAMLVTNNYTTGVSESATAVTTTVQNSDVCGTRIVTGNGYRLSRVTNQTCISQRMNQAKTVFKCAAMCISDGNCCGFAYMSRHGDCHALARDEGQTGLSTIHCASPISCYYFHFY